MNLKSTLHLMAAANIRSSVNEPGEENLAKLSNRRHVGCAGVEKSEIVNLHIEPVCCRSLR